MDKFWEGNQIKADFVVYDYPLGAGRPAPDGATPAMAEGWKYLNQLKADLVIFSGDTVWIAEIKPTMDAGAFGQVFVYSHLYRQEHGFDKLVIPLIICEITHPDLMQVAKDFNMDVLQVSASGVAYANRANAPSFYENLSNA